MRCLNLALHERNGSYPAAHPSSTLHSGWNTFLNVGCEPATEFIPSYKMSPCIDSGAIRQARPVSELGLRLHLFRIRNNQTVCLPRQKWV